MSQEVGSDASMPDAIASQIRNDLIEGILLPGSRLTEGALTSRFSAGRHSVRAAIQMLVVEGLLVHERNKGALVPQITEARIDEMCSYRAVLELGALRMALAGGADLQGVADAVDALGDLPEDAPWRTVIDVHARIHDEIVVAGGNERIIKAHRDCEAELTTMFALIKPDFSARRFSIMHQHLLEQLLVGGEVALRALEDDLELGGRAAMHLALRRQREVGRSPWAASSPDRAATR